MTTTIKESVTETLNQFQSILVKTCDDMITQQISTININIINTITTTLVEQQLNQKRIIANHIKQNGTNQPSNNLLQYV